MIGELRRVWAPPLLFAGVFLVLLFQLNAAGAPLPLDDAANAWATITMAIVAQALPFLVLGVVLSGAISAFVPASWLARATPRNRFLSVPVAGVAGMVLPGCECASVPVAQSLMRRGLPKVTALVFMIAAPAVNPVVLAATAVAFSGQPLMVWARLAASLLAVIIVGWTWVWWGRDEWIRNTGHVHEGPSRLAVFRRTFMNDLMQAGGFLVVGAVAAALIKVLVPRDWFVALAQQPLVAVAVMALVAVLLSLCSEADAFVAVSFTAVSPTAQLAFLVVGPMVDLKLMAMQWGAFGPRFVARFVPITLVVATASALLVGRLFFGSW